MNSYDNLMGNLRYALARAVHENPRMRKKSRQGKIIKLHERFKNNARRKWRYKY